MPRVSGEAGSLCIPTAQAVVGGGAGAWQGLCWLLGSHPGGTWVWSEKQGRGTRGRDGEVSGEWVGKNQETQCMTLQLKKRQGLTLFSLWSGWEQSFFTAEGRVEVKMFPPADMGGRRDGVVDSFRLPGSLLGEGRLGWVGLSD